MHPCSGILSGIAPSVPGQTAVHGAMVEAVFPASGPQLLPCTGFATLSHHLGQSWIGSTIHNAARDFWIQE